MATFSGYRLQGHLINSINGIRLDLIYATFLDVVWKIVIRFFYWWFPKVTTNILLKACKRPFGMTIARQNGFWNWNAMYKNYCLNNIYEETNRCKRSIFVVPPSIFWGVYIQMVNTVPFEYKRLKILGGPFTTV